MTFSNHHYTNSLAYLDYSSVVVVCISFVENPCSVTLAPQGKAFCHPSDLDAGERLEQPTAPYLIWLDLLSPCFWKMLREWEGIQFTITAWVPLTSHLCRHQRGQLSPSPSEQLFILLQTTCFMCGVLTKGIAEETANACAFKNAQVPRNFNHVGWGLWAAIPLKSAVTVLNCCTICLLPC